MVIPLLPLAGALVGRTVATRIGTGLAGRAVASGAGQFGGAALQRGIQNRHSAQGGRQDVGLSQHIKENPGEAAVGYGLMLARQGTMRDQAAASTASILQSTQFGNRA